MDAGAIHLMLADDDEDDCMLFEEALKDMQLNVELTVVHDGDKLMKLLQKSDALPGLLLLDVNMPRKNGFECLTEIKSSDKLKNIEVIIYSTSLDPDTINILLSKGALRYVRKPIAFTDLKKIVKEIVTNATTKG